MISDAIGSKPKVIGSSSATVAVGPMPGSTPTSGAERDAEQADQDVARLQGRLEPQEQSGEIHDQPPSQSPKSGRRSCSNPTKMPRLSTVRPTAMARALSGPVRVACQRGEERRHEQRRRRARAPRWWRRRRRSAATSMPSAHPGHRSALGVWLADVRVTPRKALHGDDRAQDGEHAAEHDRHVAGAHLQRRAHVVPAAAEGEGEAECDEGAAGQQVGATDRTAAPRRPAVSPDAAGSSLIRP